MGLRVNVSEKEAGSEARSFSPVPRGEYHVKVTDGDLRESQSDKNRGKPYYALELTIQDGEYENRKVWTNVMLFEGALYSAVQICKALGQDVTGGEMEIPDLDELIGTDFLIKVTIKKETEEYDAKNEVRWFKSWDGKVPGKGEASYLP
jgi:hypothetical protein